MSGGSRLISPNPNIIFVKKIFTCKLDSKRDNNAIFIP